MPRWVSRRPRSSGRGQALSPVQQTQPVVDAALLGFHPGQDDQQPGGQGLVRFGYLLRIGLLPVFPPAQLPQPSAEVAGGDGGAPAVPLPQATLTRLAGAALRAGEGTIGAC